MSGVVVDASVASKWFLAEADSAKAWQLVSAGQPLFAPSLVRIEVAAAITRQVRMGSIDIPEAELKLGHLWSFVAAPTITLRPDDALLARAAQMALQLNHPLQDCIYLACAEVDQAELVTTDAMLLRRASSQFSFVRSL